MKMLIQQFEDKGLSHYAYAVISQGEMALIDPARNPQPYYELAGRHQARITAILETHSHADFVSSHLEIALKTGAPIYVSEHMKATFPAKKLVDGASFRLGELTFQLIYTPGHSYDSACFLLLDANGKEKALFSGDTLFIGDVGRPDLRENIQNDPNGRRELARAMFHTINQQLRPLPDHTLVYPAHGAGTLCGKSLSDAASSTIGAEKTGNYAFHIQREEDFINSLLEDQPFVPHYFSIDVTLNLKGAPPLEESLAAVPVIDALPEHPQLPLIDSRSAERFRQAPVKGAFNIPDGLKFETWLGSILYPAEAFYLIVEDETARKTLLEKIARIGYESNIRGLLIGTCSKEAQELQPEPQLASRPGLQLENRLPELPDDFKAQPENYTIIDVRNRQETAGQYYFEQALNIPLPELRRRATEVPQDKPIAVHCASGYRSGVARSILSALLPGKIYDIGNAIEARKTD